MKLKINDSQLKKIVDNFIDPNYIFEIRNDENILEEIWKSRDIKSVDDSIDLINLNCEGLKAKLIACDFGLNEDGNIINSCARFIIQSRLKTVKYIFK